MRNMPTQVFCGVEAAETWDLHARAQEGECARKGKAGGAQYVMGLTLYRAGATVNPSNLRL